MWYISIYVCNKNRGEKGNEFERVQSGMWKIWSNKRERNK